MVENQRINCDDNVNDFRMAPYRSLCDNEIVLQTKAIPSKSSACKTYRSRSNSQTQPFPLVSRFDLQHRFNMQALQSSLQMLKAYYELNPPPSDAPYSLNDEHLAYSALLHISSHINGGQGKLPYRMEPKVNTEINRNTLTQTPSARLLGRGRGRLWPRTEPHVHNLSQRLLPRSLPQAIIRPQDGLLSVHLRLH